ncbi:hypothetical protein Taro_052652 [Colocasia esculenta]|uniref:Aminotransferase-like plant mobile domain-containing protein n=1 Tax=Colocasia esculenta TaxID=4460 RepID=A0A843XJ57_COLES|nr:hypothetical protein [Colocasia esculenta]
MGFGEILGMERMRADPALTQGLRSRWDAEATAFAFPWGHMIPSFEDVSRITGFRIYGWPVSGYTYPCYHDLAERLLELPVERRSSLVPRVLLQESLELFDVAKVAGESDDEHLDRLTRVSRRELVSEPGAQNPVCHEGRCSPLPFLAPAVEPRCGRGVRLGSSLPSTSVRQPGRLGAADLDERVWTYLHLPALGRGELARPGVVPIARRWDPIWDSRSLGDQLERPQEAIDSYPYLDSAMEFPVRDRFHRLGRSFRGLHDTTDWRERAKEQIDNWERRGKAVKSNATTDDAYFQAYALKYGGKVDVAGEVASLRALLYSAMQDREAAQRQTAELESVYSNFNT